MSEYKETDNEFVFILIIILMVLIVISGISFITKIINGGHMKEQKEKKSIIIKRYEKKVVEDEYIQRKYDFDCDEESELV